MTQYPTDEPFNETCHAYFDGALSQAEAEQFLAQLKTNPEGEATFKQYQALHDKLHALEMLEPPSGLAQKIQARIEAEAAANGNVIPLQKTNPWIRSVAAALLLLTVSGALLLPAWRNNPPTSSDAQLEADLQDTWQGFDDLNQQASQQDDAATFFPDAATNPSS